jgi:hypothetical protein
MGEVDGGEICCSDTHVRVWDGDQGSVSEVATWYVEHCGVHVERRCLCSQYSVSPDSINSHLTASNGVYCICVTSFF